MKVRCKFQLQQIISHAGHGAKTFIFHPQYDTLIPEDQRFNTATPTGKFEIYVNNPVVIEHYKLGEYYYFDSEPVKLPAADPVLPPVAA